MYDVYPLAFTPLEIKVFPTSKNTSPKYAEEYKKAAFL